MSDGILGVVGHIGRTGEGVEPDSAPWVAHPTSRVAEAATMTTAQGPPFIPKVADAGADVAERPCDVRAAARGQAPER